VSRKERKETASTVSSSSICLSEYRIPALEHLYLSLSLAMSSALFNRAAVDPPTWPVKDIVYVSIVGTVMLAALLEWILWLLAFLFCLAKVVQKAENWSVRILALANMVFFVAMRCIFLPIMVVTLPLPEQVMSVFPEEVVGILQWVCCLFDILHLFYEVGRFG
jgi:hypothetical protein